MASKQSIMLVFAVAILLAVLQIVAPAQNGQGFSPTQSYTWTGVQAFPSGTSVGSQSSGASTSAQYIDSGGTGFSQGGLIYRSNGTAQFGLFHNLDATVGEYFTLYDYIGDKDRWESYQGANARLHLQPTAGYLAVGPQASSTPQLMSVVGGSGIIADPTSLGSESLTNGALTSGTSWTCSNDCSLTANAATWTFSGGAASVLAQASGSLAVAGVGLRLYKLTYVVSAVSGSPTAGLTSTFATTSSNSVTALDLRAGSRTLYFQSVASPGNFQITSTLTTGQAFTLDTLSLKEVTGGSWYVGNQSQARTFATATNCASSAAPAVCGSAAAGSAVVAAAATTVVVNTSAVAANSDIVVSEDSSLGTKLGVTCNTQSSLVLGTPRVTARTAGTSFTVSIDVGPTTNPLCLNYWIVN